MTGLDFIAVEDDNSIGTFVTKSSRVSFHEVPKDFNFDNDLNSTFLSMNHGNLIKNQRNYVIS